MGTMRPAVGAGGTRGLVDRLIHRTGTLLRRRGRLMLGAAGVTFGVGLAVLPTLPSTYTARALVGPAAGVYDGPIERLVEQVLAPASLSGVASECDVARDRTIGEVLAGVPADRLGRLSVHIDVRGRPAESVVVEAAGTSRETAVKAADLVAARLVACDAAHRVQGVAALRSDAAGGATTKDPAAQGGAPARLLLEELRLRYPLLRDPSPERRLQDLAQRLSEGRIAVATLEAQLDGLTAESERLQRVVDQESRQAWRLELAERQAQAARLVRSTPAPEAPTSPAPTTRPAPAPAPTSRVAELEAELARLLASRTTLHPDVRRLMRLLESERQRLTSLSAPAANDGRQAGREPDAPLEEVSPRRAALPVDPAAPLVVAVADGPPDVGPPLAAGGPETWTQRVPSYPAWIEAQHRAEEVALQLVARREEQGARQREHDLLAQQLAHLRDPRLEEARLVERLSAEEELARRSVAAPTAVGRPLTPPLVVLQPAGVHGERSPSRHLAAWALASVILPLLGGLLLELRDRSVRGIEDVEGLGAPILGVVPHLRARGR